LGIGPYISDTTSTIIIGYPLIMFAFGFPLCVKQLGIPEK